MAGYEDFFKRYARYGIKPGLERITALLGGIGNPQQGFKAAHVAGTNGKGSTAAMLASILQASGLKVGLFTSPHLSRFSERIKVCGEMIPDSYIAGFIQKIEPVLKQLESSGIGLPTEFELMTALAFDYFNACAVDIAVVEVGLGGRLDSTNCIKPLVSVITSIDLDHTNILGANIELIAYEKAGIIKPGVPVVCAHQVEAAFSVIRDKAKECASALYVYGDDFNVVEKRISGCGQLLDINGLTGLYTDVHIPFLGRHQQENAALAVVVAEVLRLSGFNISPEHIVRGLKDSQWPGRAEVLRRSPVVIVDGAHNLSGVRAILATLEDFFPGRRTIMVVGILKDKDWVQMIKHLASCADVLIATTPCSPRALDANRLAVEASKIKADTMVCEAPEDAVRAALNKAGPDDVVCITGSLYLIGHVRDFLLRETS